MKIKRTFALLLTVLILLQTAGAFSATAAESTASVFNTEGIWLTEIYQDDIDRSVDYGESGYESTQTYPCSDELMEFVELTSTYSKSVSLNSKVKIYYGDTLLNITDMSGNSKITVTKGRSVVLWNYRSDLLPEIPEETEESTEIGEIETQPKEITSIPTEEEFRVAMKIPDSALVLKTETGIDWQEGTFSIKNKTDGTVVSAFTLGENEDNREGYSVELKIPDMGSEMAVYHQMSIPSPGCVYQTQLNGLTKPSVPSSQYAKGVYLTEVRSYDTDKSAIYGTDTELTECVEIVNTTSSAVDLNSNYQLVYFEQGKRKILPLYQYGNQEESCIIPAGSSAVLWCCRQDAENPPTLQDFRTEYAIDESVPVFIFTNQQGLSNTGCGLEIYRVANNGAKTLVSSYCAGGDDLSQGFSAELQVNPEGPHMLLKQANAEITMGIVTEDQYKYVQDNGTSITLAPDSTVPKKINQGEDLRVCFAITSNSALPRTNITSYYRYDGDEQWQICNTALVRNVKMYQFILTAEELFSHESVEFYIKTENRYRSTYQGVYKVNISKLNKVSGIRTNISKNEEIKGTVTITANDGGANLNTKIYIDGEEQIAMPAIEDGGWLSFTMSDRDMSLRSSLTTVDDEVISQIGVWRNITKGKQTIRIDNSYFDYKGDTCDVTLRFRSGTRGTILEDYLVTTATRNSYSLENISLNLVNGNTYYPVSVASPSGEALAVEKGSIYWLGDNCPYIDVSFSLPTTEVTAVGTELDTTTLKEGVHTVTVSNGSASKQVNFIVDNTAPTVKPKITNNSTLTGSITIKPTVTDANTVKSTTVFLDGEKIETPYKTTAYTLGKGSHTLEVSATDMAGNSRTQKVSFSVSYTDIALKSSSATKVTYNSAKLNIRLKKANSSSKAVFYRAKKISSKNIAKTTSTGIQPYVKYTINIGTVSASDKVVVNWKGTTSDKNSNHALRMFVLNTKTKQWEKVATANSSGVIDKASFTAENHVKDGKATVLVQSTTETASPYTERNSSGSNKSWKGTTVPQNYDFAFAWQSDTQIYSKRYPSYYKQMNKWIVNNAEKLKIKYVIHTGDLTDDSDLSYEWDNADSAVKVLDNAYIPYGVLAGNHDVGGCTEDNTNYWRYFGESRFSSKSYYGGSYNNNLCHYDLISQDGQDFVIVYMSWNIYQEEIDWVNSVLSKYSDRKAIICLHSYLNPSYTTPSLLAYHGKLVQSQIVAKNSNVFAVLNGHSAGAAYETAKFDDDGDGVKERTVYQICINYQKLSKGGSQYMALLYFDVDGGKVYMNTYSPMLGDYNYYNNVAENINAEGKIAKDTDCAIMDVEFNTKVQTLNAKSFSAYVSANTKLGTATVDSNGKAYLKLNNLSANITHIWYAEITGTDSGKLKTDFYSFKTLKAPAISASTKKLKAGQTYTLTAQNTNGEKVTYTVSKRDMQYIRVTQKGKITALKKNKAPATVKVAVGKKVLKCKVTVTSDPKLTDKKGKAVKTVTVKKGKQKTVYIKGKAVAISNVYTSTANAKIIGKKNATAIKIKGKRKGTSTVKVKVNKAYTIKLAVVIK